MRLNTAFRIYGLVASILALSLSVLAQDQVGSQKSQAQLYRVQKVYVGSMGETDEAERFRLLLEEQLSGKGFTVVDGPEKADAILTGVLSVRVHDKKTQARVYVIISNPGGERLWGRDFGSRLTSPFNRTEPVKLRAKDVANALRDDWMRSK